MTIIQYYFAALFAVFLIAIFSFAGRAHGVALEEGGQPTGWPKWKRDASMVVFGLGFGIGNYLLFHNLILATIAIAITILGLNTGHGRFFTMNGANLQDPEPEAVEKIVMPIFTKFGWKLTNPAYSWACMAVKGAWIALPVPILVPLLAFLWPLCYYISNKVLKRGTAPAEWLSGGSTGAALAMFYLSIAMLS